MPTDGATFQKAGEASAVTGRSIESGSLGSDRPPVPGSHPLIVEAPVPGIGARDGFRWMDLLWLALVGFLAVLSPVREIHKQLILLAIGLFQIFDRRLLASIPPSRRNAYSVTVKIALATFLIGHTNSNPAIQSPYWLIYFVPVVSAAMVYEALGTLFWTALASAAYCSYLVPALREYEFTGSGPTDLAIRILFLFLAAIIVNRFATDNRRQAESYRRLAETLSETNRRLERAEAEVRRSERLAALGQLIAGVAHEIRNPLGVIKGSAEMLARKLSPSNALAGELAGNISSEADRLNGIVTRFLDFARPMQMRRELTSLPPILDRALKSVGNGCSSARVELERQYAADLPPVPVDAELCEQVFSNLALNACQAMGEQGGKLKVAARAANDGVRPGVEIEFQDSGPGVLEELREQIFNPFFTTKRDGVGLGLSIVAKIVSEHGGSIRLLSEPGNGACFRIFLPRD
jgi:two-component system, NtrC family, sensor histidine kinase HydH